MAKGSTGNASPIRGGMTRNTASSIHQQQARIGATNDNNAQQGRSSTHAGGKWAAQNAYRNNHR